MPRVTRYGKMNDSSKTSWKTEQQISYLGPGDLGTDHQNNCRNIGIIGDDWFSSPPFFFSKVSVLRNFWAMPNNRTFRTKVRVNLPRFEMFDVLLARLL